MNKPLRITIDSKHTLEAVDRRQLKLTAVDGKRIGIGTLQSRSTQLYVHSLNTLATMLLSLGIITQGQTQNFTAAKELLRERLEQATSLHQQNEESIQRFSFSQGNFTATFNPLNANGAGSDWRLMNPGKTVLRLPGDDIVGFLPSLHSCVWSAAERTLLAQAKSISYAHLDQEVLTVVDALTADLHVVPTTNIH